MEWLLTLYSIVVSGLFIVLHFSWQEQRRTIRRLQTDRLIGMALELQDTLKGKKRHEAPDAGEDEQG